MIRCLIALTALFPAAALAATIWMWVDEQGQRHYSDREVPGATPMEIGGAQTFSGSAQGSAGPVASTAPTQNQSPYETLEVLSPEDDETVRNIEGNLPVSIGTYPRLAAGHFVDVILDGQRRGMNVRALDFTVPEVFRGTHTLAAVVVDGANRVLVQSAPVTFFVQQTSSQVPPGAAPALGRAPTLTPRANPGNN
jgi:hypothetical protein